MDPLTHISALPPLPSSPPIQPPSHSLRSLSPTMSTTSLQSFLHHHHHCSFPSSSTKDSSSSPFLRPTTPHKPFPSLTTPSSLLTPTTAPTSSLDALATHLAAADFRRADEATRRLIIDLAGDDARTRGYVYFSEVQFISAADLRAIDRLWRRHSGDRFGYSVQRRLWEKSRRDFTNFFIRVGWMKRLESSEVEQYNYRAFPEEFVWEIDAPEGHLPLTNALRGTQLLGCILTHPAFEEEETEGGEGGVSIDTKASSTAASGNTSTSAKKTLLNPDYSF